MFKMYGRPILDSIASGNLDQMKKMLAASEVLLAQRDDAEAGTEESKEWEAAHKELLTAIAEKESVKLSKNAIVAIHDGIVVLDSIQLARALKAALDSDEEGFYCELKIGWK
ncbi:DUF1843 domain-containing protein [Bradyrhizobium sp. HKCCYLRH3099]|uniref:DUF1843 domain-containing protein n=1 Tax=unclassified Bradyrhizobium TaxID=2631580 RepID=UPI003EBC71D9